ncbi:MAG: DUF1080 domain-containing protein [Planctomycetota bacterium]|nr:DUF1080 domain-containing protein [Planctomycetota bacterium]
MSLFRLLTLTLFAVSFLQITGCDSGESADSNYANNSNRSESQDTPITPTTPDAQTTEQPTEQPVIIEMPIAPAPEPLPNTTEDLAEGWIQLFDGATLFGWQAATQANWQVADGAITVSEGDAGLLYTTTEFTNYTLHLEFKSDAETNSGIFLSTSGTPSDPAKDCYEFNIAPLDNPFPTGSLVARKRIAPQVESTQWHTVQITVLDNQISALLDGNLVLDYQDSTPLGKGHIGLQLNSGAVAFRNIRLQPLALTTIFNGKDLTGWVEYPDMESDFSVTTDGFLNVKNGKGQLETEGHYANFVLQLECISHLERLNSGIFFRCIPGDEMMGYESQIQNGMQGGDPTVPEDCGTGGIFRRQDARRIVAQDQQWFHKTIIACDDHIAVWVNGYQVTDWTDTRKSDENPRRGLRTAAGSIMIQGHDPTTDLSFRNLRISEM